MRYNDSEHSTQNRNFDLVSSVVQMAVTQTWNFAKTFLQYKYIMPHTWLNWQSNITAVCSTKATPQKLSISGYKFGACGARQIEAVDGIRQIVMGTIK
jgi:hypothetical protein